MSSDAMSVMRDEMTDGAEGGPAAVVGIGKEAFGWEAPVIGAFGETIEALDGVHRRGAIGIFVYLSAQLSRCMFSRVLSLLAQGGPA